MRRPLPTRGCCATKKLNHVTLTDEVKLSLYLIVHNVVKAYGVEYRYSATHPLLKQ